MEALSRCGSASRLHRRRRRSARFRRIARARRRRRHAESRGATPGDRKARRSRHRRGYPLDDRGPLRTQGSRRPDVKRLAAPAYGVLRARRVESRFEALYPEGLTELVGREEELALLTRPLLALGVDGRYPEPSLAPLQRRRRVLDALVAQIEGLSRRVPSLMIFEDAQWADPSSLEALDRLVDCIEGLNALLIVTCRPEFTPALVRRPHVSVLTLSRLTRPEIAAMVRNVAGDTSLPETVVRHRRACGGRPAVRGGMTTAFIEVAESASEAPACAFTSPMSFRRPPHCRRACMLRCSRASTGSARTRDILQMAASLGGEDASTSLSEGPLRQIDTRRNPSPAREGPGLVATPSIPAVLQLFWHRCEGRAASMAITYLILRIYVYSYTTHRCLAPFRHPDGRQPKGDFCHDRPDTR